MPATSPSTIDRLTRKLASIGIPMYVTSSGRAVAPGLADPMGAIMSTPAMLGLLDCQPEAGAWIVWLDAPSEEPRRAALLLSADFLEGPRFAEACRQARVPIAIGRGTCQKLARFNATSVGPASDMVRALASDLDELHDQTRALDGFTAELGQSYEHINLLYTLGRAMTRPEDPINYTRFLIDRLRESGDFGWTAAVLPCDPSLGRPDPIVLASGRELPAEVTRALLSHADSTLHNRTILQPGCGLCVNPDREAIVQSATHANRSTATIFAGDKLGRDDRVSSYDLQLVESAAQYLGAFLRTAGLFADQRAMFLGTLKALTTAIDAKDRYTRGHSERVAWLSRSIAVASGMDESTAHRVHIAGLVHDIGKIGVPEAVLCKAGRLTDEEFAHIRRHPEVGHNILVGIPQLTDVLPGVLHHHERWDGKGYPRGLRGEEIPLVARIIAVADTFDAMSSTRSYRSARTREFTLSEIARSAGTQLDPTLASLVSSIDLTPYDQMLQGHAAADPAPAEKADAAAKAA